MVIASAVVMALEYCMKSFCFFPACSSHWLNLTLYYYFQLLWFFNKLLFLSDNVWAVFLIRYTIMSASYHCNDNARQFPCLQPPVIIQHCVAAVNEMKQNAFIQFSLIATQNAFHTASLTQYAFISTTSYLISQVSETTHGQKVEHHSQGWAD